MEAMGGRRKKRKQEEERRSESVEGYGVYGREQDAGVPSKGGEKREKRKCEKTIRLSLRVFSKGGRGYLWAFIVPLGKRKKGDRV